MDYLQLYGRRSISTLRGNDQMSASSKKKLRKEHNTEILTERQKQAKAEEFRQKAHDLRDVIEKTAFFTDRYARVILPDGKILGTDGEFIDILYWHVKCSGEV